MKRGFTLSKNTSSYGLTIGSHETLRSSRRVTYKTAGFTLVELSIVLVIIGLLIGGILVAQSMIRTARVAKQVQQLQQFDAADIYPSAYTVTPSVAPFDGTAYAPNRMKGGFIRGGIYELRTATMVDLIRTAWGVDAASVTGGPAWLEWDRFDLTRLSHLTGIFGGRAGEFSLLSMAVLWRQPR